MSADTMPHPERLGERYVAGKSVPQADTLAYLWFSLAGGAVATFKRNRVAECMTRAQLNQAKELVRKWEPVFKSAEQGDLDAQKKLDVLLQSRIA